MANVIEIVIRANDQATATLAKTEAATAGLTSRLQALATIGFAAVAGAAVGAIASMAKAAESYGAQVEQLSNLAKTTDSTVANIQVLNAAFEEAGLGSGVAEAALKRLSIAIGQNDPMLARLGITSKSSYEAMLQLADVFPRLADQADRNTVAFTLLGRGGRDAGIVFDGLRTRVGQLNDEMSKSGGLISKDAEAIALASDSINDYVKRRTDAMKNQIGQLATLSQLIAFAQFDAFIGNAAGGKKPLQVPGIEVSAAAPPIKTQAQIDAEKAAADAQLKASQALSEFLQSVRQGALRGGSVAGLLGGDGRGTLSLAAPANDPGTRLTQAGERIARVFDRIASLADSFGGRLASNFGQTLSRVTQIVARSNNLLVQLFVDLTNAITGTVSQMLAQLAAGGILQGLGALIGGPVGGIVGAAGGRIIGGHAAIPTSGGNVTYNINTMSPASVLSDLTSPTGTLRSANSRVGELRRKFA